MDETFSLNHICINCMQDKGEQTICPHCHFDESQYHAQAHHLSPRTILNGKYLLGRVLGEGGFGITYKGWDLNLEIPLAIKEYYPCSFASRQTDQTGSIYAYSSGEEYFQQGKNKFIDEARRLAKFQNLSSIVSVKDYFLENNTAYIVMEYLDGITLKQYLIDHGTMDMEACLTLFQDLILSLDKIHQSHIIHRDISPDNIILLNDGRVKLIDFGAARDIENNQQSKTVNVKNGFAPMEQYLTHGDQGSWSDVYALCATIYTCISGKVPPQSLMRLQEDHLQRPSELGAHISPLQEEVLMKGLSVSKEARYQTMKELYEAFYTPKVQDIKEEPLQETTTLLHDEEPLPPKPSHQAWFQNKKILSLLIVLLLIGGGVLAWFVFFDESPKTAEKVPEKVAVTLEEKDHGEYMQEYFYNDDEQLYIHFQNAIYSFSQNQEKSLNKIVSYSDIESFVASQDGLLIISDNNHHLYHYDRSTQKTKRLNQDDMSTAFGKTAYQGQFYYARPQSTSSKDYEIIKVDIDSGQETIFKEADRYLGFVFEDDMMYLATLSNDGTQISTYHLQNQKENAIVTIDGTLVNMIVDNQMLYYTYMDRLNECHIEMYDIRHQEKTEIMKTSQVIGGMAISDDHDYIYFLYLNEDYDNDEGMYRVKAQKDADIEGFYDDANDTMIAPYGSDYAYFIDANHRGVTKFNFKTLEHQQWITSEENLIAMTYLDDNLYVMSESNVYWVDFDKESYHISKKTSSQNQQSSSQQQSQNSAQQNNSQSSQTQYPQIDIVKTKYAAGEIVNVKKYATVIADNHLNYQVTNVQTKAASRAGQKTVAVDVKAYFSASRDSDEQEIYPFDFVLHTLSTNQYLMPTRVTYQNQVKTFPIDIAHTTALLHLEYTISDNEQFVYFIQSNIADNVSAGNLYVTTYQVQ